jgi:hypothetical protein
VRSWRFEAKKSLFLSRSPVDFNIFGLHGDIDSGYLTAVGTNANSCPALTGLQVKVTTYDPKVDILIIDDEWAASISTNGAKRAVTVQISYL